MADEVIERGAWPSFCERLSPLLDGKRAEVEVASLRLGDQVAAEWAAITGVSYDPANDVFSVHLPNLDHLIQQPSALAVQWRGPVVESLAITDAEGALHLVRFREPLMLPTAASSREGPS